MVIFWHSCHICSLISFFENNLITFIYFGHVPWCTCGGQKVTWCWVSGSLLPLCGSHGLTQVIGLVVISVFIFWSLRWSSIAQAGLAWTHYTRWPWTWDLLASTSEVLRLQAWATPCFKGCWDLTQGFIHVKPADLTTDLRSSAYLGTLTISCFLAFWVLSSLLCFCNNVMEATVCCCTW